MLKKIVAGRKSALRSLVTSLKVTNQGFGVRTRVLSQGISYRGMDRTGVELTAMYLYPFTLKLFC